MDQSECGQREATAIYVKEKWFVQGLSKQKYFIVMQFYWNKTIQYAEGINITLLYISCLKLLFSSNFRPLLTF
jgi:hypothetical protein